MNTWIAFHTTQFVCAVSPDVTYILEFSQIFSHFKKKGKSSYKNVSCMSDMFHFCIMIAKYFVLVHVISFYKMKKKHYHTVGTVPKSNREVVETEAKKIPLSHIYMTPNTYIHDLYHIYTWPLTFLAWYKYKLKQHYFKNAKPPSYYNIGNRYLNILHTRIRNNCSALRNDLFHAIWFITHLVLMDISQRMLNIFYCTARGLMHKAIFCTILY